jgi:hypothetical protein
LKYNEGENQLAALEVLPVDVASDCAPPSAGEFPASGPIDPPSIDPLSIDPPSTEAEPSAPVPPSSALTPLSSVAAS